MLGAGRRYLSGLILATAVLTACGEQRDAGTTDRGDTDSTAAPNVIEGSFDVGGHELYLSCSGDGSPTIVYLHGSDGNSGNAGSIPDLLTGEYRVCVYDRANVGRSGRVAGPIPAEAAVSDLKTLLDVAEVPGPYLLLAASFGGLLGYTYAGTYPDTVSGMVLLDPSLPGEPEWEREWLPEDDWLPPDAWESTREKIDLVSAYDAAKDASATLPPIPVTLIATEEIPLPPDVPDAGVEALRAMQHEMVADFDPGNVILVEAPHYMEPEIPELIAETVRQVASAAGG